MDELAEVLRQGRAVTAVPPPTGAAEELFVVDELRSLLGTASTNSDGSVRRGDPSVQPEEIPAAPLGDPGDGKRKARDRSYDPYEQAVEEDSKGKRKKTKAAEVHNQLERRRRERINEKMRALQQLNPRCNRSDTASVLEDAAEYMKSLQLQIKNRHEQMMSAQFAMSPMMFPPGFQNHAASMRMMMGSGMEFPFRMVPPFTPMMPIMPPMPGLPVAHQGPGTSIQDPVATRQDPATSTECSQGFDLSQNNPDPHYAKPSSKEASTMTESAPSREET